jgi:eukaryotic-like serine/threonine-protein kinase
MDRIKAGVATTYRDQLPPGSRYELLVRIAAGGMATVYVGRLSGPARFWRLVAIKRAHAHLLEDASFTKMLIAEARLASKIHHPNVVAVQDVEELDGELLLVMDYVEGASLAALATQAEEAGDTLSTRAVVRMILDACAGLHAAHELVDEDGRPLCLVHRDVSPHNVVVGVDGVTRLADFGIAKVSQTGSGGGTATGALKGKVAYMAPEYVETGHIDARGDVFALGIVAWEALARRRLFRGSNDIETLRLVTGGEIPAPSSVAPWVDRALDPVILRALERAPDSRFATAQAFGEALEEAARKHDLIAAAPEVGRIVRALVGPALDQRRSLIRERMPPSDKSQETSGVLARGALKTEASEATATETPLLSVSASGEPLPEGTTLGSGVSSRNVRVVREEIQRRPRRRAIVPIALLLTLGALAGTAFKLTRTRASPPQPAGIATNESGPAAPASASAPTPSSVSTSTLGSASTATPLPATAPPAAPRARPKPPPARLDKAPPNPYGR